MKYNKYTDDYVFMYLQKGEILPKEVTYWHGGAGLPADEGKFGYAQYVVDPESGWGPEAKTTYYSEWWVKGVSVRMKHDLRISIPREVYNSIRIAENEFGLVSL